MLTQKILSVLSSHHKIIYFDAICCLRICVFIAVMFFATQLFADQKNNETIVFKDKTIAAEPWQIKIPRKADAIRFSMTLSSPTSETTIPALFMSFKSKVDETLAKADIFGDSCKGEYDFSLSFSDSFNTVSYEHAEDLIQWSETFDVSVEEMGKSKKNHRYKIMINDKEFEFNTYKDIRKLEILSSNGYVDIENFRFVSSKRR